MAKADTLVLCYHAVSERWPADLSTTPQALERQLAHLVRRGYRGVTFAEAVRPGPGRRLAVTFDDAYRSVHRLALPILADLGLPGTLFVPTAYVDGEQPMAWPGIDRWLGGPFEQELLCASSAELADLVARGWEVAAHSHTHPRLSALEGDALRQELEQPRALLEEWLGRPCDSLAYPYGDFSAAVARAAAAAGYRAAATLDASLPPADPLLWPRVGVYHTDGLRRFRLKASALSRRLGLARLRHPRAASLRGGPAAA